MSIKAELVRFIQQNMIEEDQSITIDEETALIDSGYIGSMQLMQLVTFIEERTGTRVPDDEVLPDNFETVNSMVEMIDRLRRLG